MEQDAAARPLAPGPGRRRRGRHGARRHGGSLPCGASACATLNYDCAGGEEPCDDLDACSVDHNHCVRKKAAWIGDMHFGFGFKWAIVEHLYHYRGSQAHGSHYDQVHSGAMMIVSCDTRC
ncbi:hypothetical protein ZWY2020_003659 [Hordeum vulgare]|nr:hypothetical protein ZWY2020_003659 [Hordeum vulgare]